MQAQVGDRLVVEGRTAETPRQEGEVLQELTTAAERTNVASAPETAGRPARGGVARVNL
jgi:uncharacterized protein YprB with RNaseH-like and TPR domain